MNTELQKFWDMMKADENLRKELEERVKNYTGEPSEKAIMEAVVIPLAQEHGLMFTGNDYVEAVQELSQDEMAQVAGGASIGFGGGTFGCDVLGSGFGSAAGIGAAGACLFIGIGTGMSLCMFSGVTWDMDECKPNRDKES